MFTVRSLGHDLETNAVITSGVTFGFFDKPLKFHVLSEKISAPYFLEFKVVNDEKRKPFELDISNPDLNRTEIVFYNPGRPGASGLKVPLGLISLENKYVLGFMFMIDVLPDAPTYRLTYEFYDGIITPPKEGCEPPDITYTGTVS
jgi:hypothetical protein